MATRCMTHGLRTCQISFNITVQSCSPSVQFRGSSAIGQVIIVQTELFACNALSTDRSSRRPSFKARPSPFTDHHSQSVIQHRHYQRTHGSRHPNNSTGRGNNSVYDGNVSFKVARASGVLPASSPEPTCLFAVSSSVARGPMLDTGAPYYPIGFAELQHLSSVLKYV